LRIEHSRRHGPFDRRYPPIRHEPTPAGLSRLGGERLDWQRFLVSFFPGSHRHDFGALSAYASSRNGADRRPADVLPAHAGSPGAVHAAASDTDRWEAEGGASTLERPDSSSALDTIEIRG